MIRKLLISLSAVLLPMSLFAQSAALQLLRDTTQHDCVLVAAHRGDWIYAPENSIASLQHDIDWGVEIIETDVRATRDGHVVIMHDPTLDRTTYGHGRIVDVTLDEIKKLSLKSNFGTRTQMKVPTLEEYIELAKGKVLLYLDKAGFEDDSSHPLGYKLKLVLDILRRHNALEEAVFVLDFPYTKARELFGDDLERVNYIPVIEDDIPNLDSYVDEYIEKLRPLAFQFRMSSLDSPTYRQLPKVMRSGARPFVAATWETHTAGHSDLKSIMKRPSEGWGWLIGQGFRILETNYPRDLLEYLHYENRR